MIKKKRLWYDVGPFGFHCLPAIILALIIFFLLFNGYDSFFYFLLLIIMFITYLVYFDDKKYGWWLVNYQVIGSLFLTNESIEIEENELKSIYKIRDLHKVQLKEDFFQNYQPNHDLIHDGITSILIDKGNSKHLVFFLLETKADFETLQALKSEWKKSGLKVWT